MALRSGLKGPEQASDLHISHRMDHRCDTDEFYA